ncbi:MULTISPECIES: ABC transporter ATP-binding protein [Gordonia]|uniref:Trehalose import ATP-binding protein SugC n=1 Tax=Gordonia amicalis TaxID=89053 RepID=A0AAE4U9W6_9ACTN|nr:MULTISPECIES: ATP-binding cassette domain-containing protein [Gordonia]ATD71919.1 sugar ABC transporter ATP-binding protein [Gordonia sp. 1D]MCZ4580986.1 ATP-binding cassette domain-containing protein [Gordonia amicalis]MDJ0451643.1 ATP-binding cassette domain-containing protein [Gordonia amicalis]MDV6306493.1 ATP-binding cassette domain-containing protein [Gordonia amicalis]MDV6311222.1 ATP-binding cassette domain-containing protein [Gordonia amicalis]
MASVTFDAATRRFADDLPPAVDSLDLDVADGEFMVLVGPSGCGKSTSLRMVAGLESVESGAILIDGVDVVGMAPRARDVAMVFQNYALYPNMTVADNMGFALRNAGMSKPDTGKRVAEVAEMLDIAHLLDRKPAKLSGGQRQRVAMGRAIVRRPKIFCMDEPLFNLDAKLRVSTRAQIAAMQRELGVSMLYVTHDQIEAMTMGHRVAVLDHGVLQQVGTPREIYSRPSNLFVASFMGSPQMCLINGRIDAGVVRLGAAHLPVPDSVLAAATSAEVVVGLRAESWTVSTVSHDGALRGTVDLVEELGAEQFVYCSADVPLRNSRIVVRVDHRRTIDVGDVVGLVPEPSETYWFDPVTGAALDDPLRHDLNS